MSFLNKIFGSSDQPVKNVSEFWSWFHENSSEFHEVVKSKDPRLVQEKLFPRLERQLGGIKDGIFFLVGMIDADTAELVLTADGYPKNVAFVEDLVDAAHGIPGWMFTALKQPGGEKFGLRLGGVEFGSDTLAFYPNDVPDMPDLVDVTIVHPAFDNTDGQQLHNGAYLYIENYLGELVLMTEIDNMRFCGPSQADKACIPIEALGNFLETRRALFVEKYEGSRALTDTDGYAIMQAQLDGGMPLVATVNTDLISWDKKPSHPWMVVVTIPYNGTATNGLPDNETAEKLNQIEEAITDQLPDHEGYLNIGRQAAKNQRDIFYACADFRKPSKVVYAVQREYASMNIEYDLYKDKYWRTVEHLKSDEQDGLIGD